MDLDLHETLGISPDDPEMQTLRSFLSVYSERGKEVFHQRLLEGAGVIGKNVPYFFTDNERIMLTEPTSATLDYLAQQCFDIAGISNPQDPKLLDQTATIIVDGLRFGKLDGKVETAAGLLNVATAMFGVSLTGADFITDKLYAELQGSEIPSAKRVVYEQLSAFGQEYRSLLQATRHSVMRQERPNKQLPFTIGYGISLDL